MDEKQEDEVQLPRFAIKIQDEFTGESRAVGANDLDLFTKTDMMEFIEFFKGIVEEAEKRPWAAPPSVPSSLIDQLKETPED